MKLVRSNVERCSVLKFFDDIFDPLPVCFEKVIGDQVQNPPALKNVILHLVDEFGTNEGYYHNLVP